MSVLELIEESILDNAGRYYHMTCEGNIPHKFMDLILEDLSDAPMFGFPEMNKVYKKVAEQHFRQLESLSLEDRIKKLGFTDEVSCRKCYANSNHRYFCEGDFDKLDIIFNPNILKQVVKVKPLQLNIPDYIKDDYDKFNCKMIIKKSAYQDKNFNPNYTIDKLLSFTNSSQFTGYFDFGEPIIWTKSMYDNIIKEGKIIDIKLYEFLLLNNILNNKVDELTTEDEDEEENIIIEVVKMNEFYKDEFRPYFYKKYKDLIKDGKVEEVDKLKLFDYFYKQINPNTYNKKSNPKEYNTYSTNKSNLKRSYKRYLNGEDIKDLPNGDKLKYIIFIINNCDKYF